MNDGNYLELVEAQRSRTIRKSGKILKNLIGISFLKLPAFKILPKPSKGLGWQLPNESIV